MIKIPIIIINWNGINDTIECVSSVLAQSIQNFIIYLVDNGSDNNEFEKLSSIYANEPRIVLQKNNENIGFTLAHNQLFDQLINANANFVALINNDAVADKFWLENALNKAITDNADMVACLMLNYFSRNLVDSAGLFLLSSGEILPYGHGMLANQLPLNKTNPVAACGGACLYKISMLNDIGTFDPYFSTGYEDAELGLRAFLTGKKISLAPDSIVYHKMSLSVKKVFNRKKAQKIQEDINFTLLKLMPASLIALNAFTNIPRTVILAIIHLSTFRFSFLRIRANACLNTLSTLKLIRSRRSAFQTKRIIGTATILKTQKFFLSHDLKRFKRLILMGEKNQFEKYR